MLNKRKLKTKNVKFNYIFIYVYKLTVIINYIYKEKIN